ncbi:spore germination protein [Dethiobacter alkaliphilus]|uniref:GerA spore germination protein n=1 Tax=Dethiobacter alkaliphilus AHT 1 TaxID=555088 RepID=C0GIJ3_DETAL|nr:spore germination protein [Dethiobacter alkaliphilus]EEG76854.1 GerA spore germination protein [Dethiobacter alkaliphilus AHT 1]
MFRFLKRKKKIQQNAAAPRLPEQEQATDEVAIDDEEIKISLVDMAPRDTQYPLRGPKKRFSENIVYNLQLLRERFSDSNLTFEQFLIGSRTRNRVVIAYLKDVAHPGIVSEVKERLRSIRTEAVIDTSYLERDIENSNISPFPQIENTTRPDVVMSALLQGRVAIISDGNPEILLAPTTLFDLMDTPEDANSRWFIAATFFRVARYIMFILAASLPAFYIAVTTFNPEFIPAGITFIIARARGAAPFPVYLETFIMMGVVEAVRMMLIRIPTPIGGNIALFSGLALVIAGLLSNVVTPIVLMVVTLAIICSFGIPNYDLRSTLRIIQFFTMIMATALGIFGFAVAFFYLSVHLASLKSFGIPYMTPLAPLEASAWGHTIARKGSEKMPQDETYKPRTAEQED